MNGVQIEMTQIVLEDENIFTNLSGGGSKSLWLAKSLADLQ